MAYAFNDDKSKVEVYAKDDFIILDVDFFGMDAGETKSKDIFLNNLSPLTVNDVVIISASVKWNSGDSRWDYSNAYNTSDEYSAPRLRLETGAGGELVIHASINNYIGYTSASPILRVVLMKI